MYDLEGQSCPVDGVKKLQHGRLTVRFAGAYLHGLMAFGNAKDGIVDNTCVVKSPTLAVNSERVISEVVLDGILKAKVMDYFRRLTIVVVVLGMAVFGNSEQ